MKQISLSTYIRKKISSRIITSLCLLFFTAIFLTVYDFKYAFVSLKNNEAKICKSLSLFIIGQILVGNNDAITIRIKNLNKGKDHYEYFMKSPKFLFKKISWHPPFSWEYVYPINNIDGRKFGFIKVSGSIFSKKHLISTIYERLLLLILFFALFFYLLYPVIKKIPEKIFIDSIRTLFNLLRNEDKNTHPDTNQPKELYQLQCDIIQLTALLTQKSKEAATGQLAAQVAHDIRSPLACMTALLEEISSQISAEKHQIIAHSIQSVRDITNNLLTQYKESAKNSSIMVDDGNKKRFVLLFSLIEYMLSQKRYEWQENPCEIHLSIQKEAKITWLYLSPNDIKRVLSNILNNAYEALEFQRNIYLDCKIQDNQIILNIRDTGKGIPSNQISAVLKGKSYKRGHGLGLSSAKKTMELFGGQLFLTSEVKHGTTVTLCFSIPEAPSWFPQSILLSQSKPILFLDDDPSMHQFWINAAHPIRLIHFMKSHDLIEWVESHPQLREDIILISDYKLQHESITGLELLKKFNIKKRGYLITSYAEELDIQQQCKELDIHLVPKSMLAEICFVTE